MDSYKIGRISGLGARLDTATASKRKQNYVTVWLPDTWPNIRPDIEHIRRIPDILNFISGTALLEFIFITPHRLIYV